MTRARRLELVSGAALLVTLTACAAGLYLRQQQRERATRDLILTLKYAAQEAMLAAVPFGPDEVPRPRVFPSHRKKVEALLRRGADPNAVDPELKGGARVSAFWYALAARDTASATLLLERGADLHRPENREALHYVSERNDVPLLQVLLRYGAEVDGRDEAGSTALMQAAHCGALDAVRFLLAHGADPNARDDSGATPLRHAEWGKERAMVRLLKAAGARR